MKKIRTIPFTSHVSIDSHGIHSLKYLEIHICSEKLCAAVSKVAKIMCINTNFIEVLKTQRREHDKCTRENAFQRSQRNK